MSTVNYGRRKIYSDAKEITALAKDRFVEERSLNHLEGWFLAKEIGMECDEKFKDEPDCIRIAKTQVEVMKRIPLTLGDYHVFAGTQDDAFARSYALINPAFTVDSFSGYCDPAAVFGDIDPYGEYQKFSGGKSQGFLTCNVAGSYDFYIKLLLHRIF